MIVLFIIYIVAMWLLIKRQKTPQAPPEPPKTKEEQKKEETIQKLKDKQYINTCILEYYRKNEKDSATAAKLEAENIIIDEKIDKLEGL